MIYSPVNILQFATLYDNCLVKQSSLYITIKTRLYHVVIITTLLFRFKRTYLPIAVPPLACGSTLLILILERLIVVRHL